MEWLERLNLAMDTHFGHLFCMLIVVRSVGAGPCARPLSALPAALVPAKETVIPILGTGKRPIPTDARIYGLWCKHHPAGQGLPRRHICL